MDVLNWTARLQGGGTWDNSLLKLPPCPLANVFSSGFRGSQENELSERRKQAMAGELLLILLAGHNTPKDLKTV